MPARRIGEVRVTRTALGGSADAAIEEATHKSLRLVQGCSIHKTQSVGTQGGGLQLDNRGNRYGAWKSPDGIKVEARLAGSGQDYVTLLDGFIGEVEYAPGVDNPVVGVQVQGWLTTLDLVQVPAETTYMDTAWTTIADNLITLCLGAGYARSITTDASVASRMTFLEGVSLRQALEMVRAGLNQGADKWEHVVEVVGGAKTYRLYKRGSSPQRVIRRADLYPEGTRRTRGSILDVVNKATVIGATISKTIVDKTGLTLTNTRRIDAATKRLAYPFTPTDTPLYAVQWTGARSKTADPPTINGFVARASSNLDLIARGYCHKRSSLILRDNVDTPANAVDDDVNTIATYNGTALDATYREVLVWDFGAPVDVASWLLVIGMNPAAGTAVDFKIQSSTDDSAWTDRVGSTAVNNTVATPPVAGNYECGNFATVTARYWRIVARKTAGTPSLVVFEADLYPWKNAATTPAFPQGITRRGFGSNSEDTDVATTGAAEVELANFDLVSARAIAKIEFQHIESAASSLLNIRVQKSDDGAAWTDLAILPSTTSLVTDSFFVEEPDFRHLRVLVDDDRTGGSASITTNGRFLLAYAHGQLPFPGTTPPTLNPLTGDQLTGSDVSWDATSLVTTPGTVEARTYPAPRLALATGRPYFFVLAGTGGSTTSYWDVDYGTESGAEDSQQSTDTGATWASIATDAVLRFRLEFNNSALVGEAEDAASQAAYAAFVPNGVLQASYFDPALVTQAAVDAEAASLVNRKKNPTERLVACIPGDPSLDVGRPVTLALDAAELLGLSAAADYDVVELNHELGVGEQGYKTYLTLNEHEDDPLAGQQTVVSGVNQRRI